MVALFFAWGMSLESKGSLSFSEPPAESPFQTPHSSARKILRRHGPQALARKLRKFQLVHRIMKKTVMIPWKTSLVRVSLWGYTSERAP